jgi:hypothetical protein
MGSATTWAPRISLPGEVEIFLIIAKYRLALVCVKKAGGFSPQIKQLEQEYNNQSPSCDKIKNVWLCTRVPTHVFVA